jgi:hypothetical protein
MRQYIHTVFVILILIFELSNSASSQPDFKVIDYGNNKESGNYITLNGAKQYYEIYGKSAPTVLNLFYYPFRTF